MHISSRSTLFLDEALPVQVCGAKRKLAHDSNRHRSFQCNCCSWCSQRKKKREFTYCAPAEYPRMKFRVGSDERGGWKNYRPSKIERAPYPSHHLRWKMSIIDRTCFLKKTIRHIDIVPAVCVATNATSDVFVRIRVHTTAQSENIANERKPFNRLDLFSFPFSTILCGHRILFWK